MKKNTKKKKLHLLLFGIYVCFSLYFNIFINDSKSDSIYLSGDLLWQHDVIFISTLILLLIFFLSVDHFFTEKSCWVIFKENCSKKNVSRAILFIILLVFLIFALLSYLWLLESIFSTKVYAADRVFTAAEKAVSRGQLLQSIASTNTQGRLFVNNQWLLNSSHHAVYNNFTMVNGQVDPHFHLYDISQACYRMPRSSLTLQHQGSMMEFITLNSPQNNTKFYERGGACLGNNSMKMIGWNAQTLNFGTVEGNIQRSSLNWNNLDKPIFRDGSFWVSNYQINVENGSCFVWIRENDKPIGLMSLEINDLFWEKLNVRLVNKKHGLSMVGSMSRREFENLVTSTDL